MTDIISKIDEIKRMLEDKLQRLRISANQIEIIHGISDISKRLGLFQSGELRFGNATEPGRGFSGVRTGSPTFVYDNEEWLFAAISDDVIQFGVRKDGTVMSLFDASTTSAFGTLETGELTPIIQGDFVYGLNTQIWSTPAVSGAGATVDTNEARLRVQSGTSSTGYAAIGTRKLARYRAGQGTVARFTPVFTSGVASNTQLAGMGAIPVDTPYDGYFFGYNGTTFGIVHYVRGVATWTPQTEWNGDTCDTATGGTFNYDPTKGTPAMIKYPYLGFGNIEFFLQSPDTGRWRLVHMIKYANSVATTQLSNPTLRFLLYSVNSGNTTNITTYCGSIGIFLSGVRSFTGNPKWATDNNKSAITTETNILSLRNCGSYNGTSNRGTVRINSISVGTSIATGVCVLRFKIGATLGGTPAFATISGTTADNGVTITSGNSIVSKNVAGTTVTGGTLIYNLIAMNGSSFLDISTLDIVVAPGETLTISAFSTTSSTIGVAVNWTEDI